MSLTREATLIRPGFSIGDVKMATYDITFSANTLNEPEPGWFLLNGAVISQTTYPILYARYGSTFNTGGEGTGNFRLPDHTEGKFPIAKGLTNFTSYGVNGGEITHTLAATEIPVHGHSDTKTFTANSHGHSASLGAATGGDHSHAYTGGIAGVNNHGGGSTCTVSVTTNANLSSVVNNSHQHTMTALTCNPNTESYNKSGGISNNTGSGSAHNNMMPYVVMGGLLVKHD